MKATQLISLFSNGGGNQEVITPTQNQFPQIIKIAQGGSPHPNGEGDEYYMYAGLAEVNGRLYGGICYRTGHDPYDGVGKIYYSDDDGQTWTDLGIVYDPVHLFTDDAEVAGLTQPEVLLDARDSRLTVTPDGSHLIFYCFVAVGNNTDTVNNLGRDYYADFRNICVRFPIVDDQGNPNVNGKDIDLVNYEIVQVNPNAPWTAAWDDFQAFSGGYFNIGNDMYFATYDQWTTSRSNYIYRSQDQGQTWSLYTKAFSNVAAGGADELHFANESCYAYVGGTLFGFGRTIANRYTKSDDFLTFTGQNATWQFNPSETSYDFRGQSCVVTEDGKIAVFSRLYPAICVFDPGTFDLIATTELDWPTSGYGTIIRYKDLYVLGWYTANDFEFRQLKYNPQTNKFSYNLQEAAVNTLTYEIPQVSPQLAINTTTTDCVLEVAIRLPDDYTDNANQKWIVYNNGVEFATFGSVNTDENVTILNDVISLPFTIQEDTDYVFTVRAEDQDGADSVLTDALAYRLNS